MNRPLSEIPTFAFNLILIDPPWDWKTWSEKGGTKSPTAHYDTMSIDDVKRLPVAHWAMKDCLLGMWATFPKLHQQLPVLEAWGFEYISAVIWHKVHPSGKTAMGTGHRVRSMCEPLLIAKRGSPKSTPFPGLFTGIRREHSRKPEEAFAMIDRCCPRLQYRADIFGRASRPGWEVYGTEATKFDEVAA